MTAHFLFVAFRFFYLSSVFLPVKSLTTAITVCLIFPFKRYYSLPTPVRTRYTFLGWYYGSEKIENGDTVALTEDATFTAMWNGIGGIITDPINPPVEEYGTGDDEAVSTFSLEETSETDTAAASYCKTYTYDLAGNRTGFTLEKFGETIHNISYSYDNLNRLSTVSENGAIEATYTYDANGNRASLTLGNGVTTTYSYNLANWVTNLSNKNSDGEVLSSYAYSYYASGNQKSKTDNTGKVTSYVYDGLGRLTSESESGGVTLSYLYDEAGNRTKLTATGTESYVIDYTYNNVNQLTSEVKTESGATETTSYTYDANGNMLSKTSPEGTQANTYNNLNQLVSSITAGVTSSYIYNVDGIRTSKTVGTTTTDYLLDGGNVVAESQNGDVTATYLRGANLLSTDNGTSTSYYLFNAHGDVTGLTNGAQTVTKSYDYDAFGNEDNPSATDINSFRYCGEYYDKETGTYYLRARYYDPSIGRFTQQDTHWNTANMIYGDNPNKINEREDALGLKSYTYTPNINSIMQSGNLYVYCVNNPTRFNDSNGEIALIASLGLKVLKGLAIKYVGDVIGNIASGKTGADIFIPTSTAGEYIAAGVSELIPGSGLAKSLFSSAIEEGIVVAEKAITGKEIDVKESLINFGVSATADLLSGEITTFIQKKADSLIPKNYSTYAHNIRKTDPNISTPEIKKYYNSYVKNNEVVKEVISIVADTVQENIERKANQILMLN